MRDFEERRRARVSGGRNSKLIGFSVLGGAILLVLMIVLGSVDPPPTEAPAAAIRPSPAPTTSPAPAAAAERLYLLGQRGDSDYRNPLFAIRAYDTDQRDSVATLEGGLDAVLAPDGSRFFVLQPTQIKAVDVATGAVAWQTLLTSPITGTRVFGAARALALSPDGGTLGVYRDRWAMGGRAGSIERFDARSGASLPPLQVNAAPRNAALLIGADGTFFVASSNTIAAIDPASGAQQLIVEEPTDSALSVGMDAAGRTLFIVSGAELITVATAPNSPVRRLPLQFDAAEGDLSFYSLAVAPAGDRLAMYLYVRGKTEINEGQLVSGVGTSEVALIDPQTGAILQRRRISTYGYGPPLRFNAAGSVLYYVEQGSIGAWDLAADRSRPLFSAESIPFFAENLFVGPSVPIQPGSPAASADILNIPITPVPQPSPTPQLQADPAPFAWILQNDTGSAQVVEYAADGTRRIVADYVIAALDQPGRPPLLIINPDADAWSLFDPLDGRTTPISMVVHLGWNQLNPNRLALSPDGDRLALITERDPIASDALTVANQLVLVDLATGQARALAEIPGRVSSEPQLSWAGDWLYLIETRALPGGNRPVRLLRLDPAAERAELEQVMDFGEDGAFVDFNPQAGRLVYQPYPEDIATSALFVRDLATGEDAIIYAGTFIDRDGFLLSPDGAYVAYVAPVEGPAGLADSRALNIYSVAAGTTIRPAEGTRPFQSKWLEWTADSSAVVFRTYQFSEPTNQSEILERRIAPDGRIINVRATPYPMFYSSVDTRRWSADESRLVRLNDQQSHALLELSDEAGNPLVALPLDLQITRGLGSVSYNTTFQPIVYVFGGR